jgi:hypothetical protein
MNSPIDGLRARALSGSVLWLIGIRPREPLRPVRSRVGAMSSLRTIFPDKNKFAYCGYSGSHNRAFCAPISGSAIMLTQADARSKLFRLTSKTRRRAEPLACKNCGVFASLSNAVRAHAGNTLLPV